MERYTEPYKKVGFSKKWTGHFILFESRSLIKTSISPFISYQLIRDCTIQDCWRAGACPSCQGVRGGLHPRQVTSLLKGQHTNNHSYIQAKSNKQKFQLYHYTKMLGIKLACSYKFWLLLIYWVFVTFGTDQAGVDGKSKIKQVLFFLKKQITTSH